MVAGHMESVENCPTIFHVLRWRAEHQPQRRAYTYLLDGEEDAADITYGELDRSARAIAAAVQQQARRGDRVLLLYPSGLEFIAAFLGCLYAGVIAVPAYQPNPRLERTLTRIRAITADARPAVVLTTTSLLSAASSLAASDPIFSEATWLATDAEADEAGSFREEAAIDQGTLAFLQYTSGSTSTPRGVMVTHGNLMHNEGLLQRGVSLTADSVIVSWLPLFHDMGLIGAVLQALYTGCHCVLMTPTAFIQRPVRWLQAFTRYGGTLALAPDFAYALCARQVSEADRAGLDLSTWAAAINGAEPVRPETIEEFTAAFGPCGFRPEALTPCYGLAEATLYVTGGPAARRPVVMRVREDALRQGTVAVAEDGGKLLASSGQVVPGQRVVIADPRTRVACPAGQIGEIWLAGPSVASGYWDSPASTEATFSARLAGTGEGPFLRTGDLGFIRDDQLFITSRLTDLIIIRGSNHAPQDIERTAENSHPALRSGSGIAFSIEDGGDARLVIVHEVRLGRLGVDCEEVATAVRQAVMEEHELDVYAVVLLKPGALSKTSSGKPQRRACRDQFMAGDLRQIGQSIRPSAAAGAFADDEGASDILPALVAAEGPDRWPMLVVYLRQHIAASARISVGQVDAGQPLTAQGLDSLKILQLKERVESELAVTIPLEWFFDYPTPAELAAALLADLERSIDAAWTEVARMTDEEAGVRLAQLSAEEN
jgi:acyl-CoA synthetase (AMP-forming)/AMP-acid ligase II/acyl carrier protein